MNVLRSCIAVPVLLLVAAIGSRAIVSAAVCCFTAANSSAVCRNGNRTFHTIETIGNGTCDGNVTAIPIRKCCPPDRTYDPESRFCRPQAFGAANATATAAAASTFRRLLDLDRLQFATLVGYDYEPPKCGNDVLVDVPADEVRKLLLLQSNEANVDRTMRLGFLSHSYCFDVTTSANRSQLMARTCRPRQQYCLDPYTCVNKCCKGDRMIVGGVYSGCKQKSTVPFQLPVFDVRDGDADALVPSSNRTVLTYYERLKCVVGRDQVFDFNVIANGSLLYYRTPADDSTDHRRRQQMAATDYCLEFVAATMNDTPQPIAYTCAEIVQPLPESEKQGSWKYFVILAGFVPSIVCLILTLLVYAALPSLRNVHGYNVMCYVVCLLVSFVCLLIIQWMTNTINSITCKFFGYTTLFAFLTTFCWLNVICFDIYWMLRYNNSINRKASISVRTVLYHVYCWGFSSIFTVTAFTFQHSQNVTLLNLAPDIGTGSCWFSNTNYGNVIFFLIPVSTMLLVNLILFVFTAVHCSRIKSELNRFKRNDAKAERFRIDKEKFVMSIKLFLVMGIPWTFEILSKILNNDWFIWHILDEINALQGVMIFIIFVAKRKVLMKLRRKITSSLDNSESTRVNTISMSIHSNSTQK